MRPGPNARVDCTVDPEVAQPGIAGTVAASRKTAAAIRTTNGAKRGSLSVRDWFTRSFLQ
jgi:hypothetical protein